MGRVWSPEAVAQHQSTATWGNISTISESRKREGLLIAGTDDGVIQVSLDGGANWRKSENPPGLPDYGTHGVYVDVVYASKNDENVVYSLFDNSKNGDFKPYVYKSTNRGGSWTAISGDLPANGPALAFAEDHVNPNLLFVGTEFGLFFTVDGGKKWIRLRNNLPTIPVRDLAIQERENDLVLATFGRGFYVLDDYSPLRTRDARRSSRRTPHLPGQAGHHSGARDRQAARFTGRAAVDGREPARRRGHHLLDPRVAAHVTAAAAGCGAGGGAEERRRRAIRRKQS